MAYEANRDNEELTKEEQKMRADQNNANNVRNAADVAIATGIPHAAIAGGIVKAADKVTGGKSSEVLGKALTNANRMAPGGKARQEALNKLNESGAGDAIGKAASIYSAGKGGPPTKNQVPHAEQIGGEQNGSLPISSDNLNKNQNPNANVPNTGKASESSDNKKKEKDKSDSEINKAKESQTEETSTEESKEKKSFIGRLLMSGLLQIVAISLIPFIVVIFPLFIAVAALTGVIGNFEDAFGISAISGEETGGVEYSPRTEEQVDFYNRLNQIATQYAGEGREFDPLLVVAVFHTLRENGAKTDYDQISDQDIEEVIQAMFDGEIYDEEYFKEQLINQIIPKYLRKKTHEECVVIADEIIKYVEDYYDLIGKERPTSFCSNASGVCTYAIKGYAIPGKGNVTENKQVSNFYVRLMQCGSTTGTNYGGTFGKPLENEGLVPFEKYVLGVSYASMGENVSSDAFKAQTVAARSYILERHADLGGWRTLEKEDGKWILQVASCAQDHIYCDPDKGCSSTSGGQVHSGLSYNGSFSRQPLSSNSPLRDYAAATEGEVLSNAQGYIISTDYSLTDKQNFLKLASQGLDYKQILVQTYNQGNHRYGASKIQKHSCTGGRANSNCSVSGDFANWKQENSKWANLKVANSDSTLGQIGCLVTSVAIQIARSGVPTNISNFNPGTFVEYLNRNGGFAAGGNFNWSSATKAAPTFRYAGQVSLSGMTREQKLATIREITSTPKVYAVAEVRGNTGQHWVAIERVNGNTIVMNDPGGDTGTDMWGYYNWNNTSTLAYFKVG